jgi:hypothetical protein
MLTFGERLRRTRERNGLTQVYVYRLSHNNEKPENALNAGFVAFFLVRRLKAYCFRSLRFFLIASTLRSVLTLIRPPSEAPQERFCCFVPKVGA